MNEAEVIEQSIESLEHIAKQLDEALIQELGQDAAWEHWVSSVALPAPWRYRPDFSALNKIWNAREEANSALFWITEHRR
jgi:hypothetical protein